MGKIYCMLGKSSTGKDTIYKKLMEDKELKLHSIVLYTTRPIREGEVDGETYHFVTEDEFLSLKEQNLIIEDREYQTIHGLWRYFTVYDGNLDYKNQDYLMIGVLKSYQSIRDYFGRDVVIPIYIEVEDGVRLQRALDRERQPENGKYAEMCRRFLADTNDFSEEKIQQANITKRFINQDLAGCVEEIKQYMLQTR